MISPLRAKRFFAELSIYDLEQKTGIDPARISLLERGYKHAREDEKRRIAEALGCKIAEVFPETQGG